MSNVSKQLCAAALCLTIAGLGPSAQAAPETTRVAVLASPSPELKDLAALLEISLGSVENVVLLDRTTVDQVLKEQQLQAMFAPAATAQRAALGQLLKADLLVMLRKQPKPRAHLEVSVCETGRGLRLDVQPLAGQSADAAVRAVTAIVRRSLGKTREKVTTIVSVPPLVDDGLSFDDNYLMPAYARLIEQTLLQRPGVVVVALEEAEAIARETAIAGGGAARPQPIVLLGRYRAGVAGGRKTLSLSLTAQRDGKTLGAWQRAAVAPADAAGELRQAAVALLGKAGTFPLVPSDGEAEAGQLAAGAKAFLDVGYCSEALAQIEASLMLKPRQPELHGHAVAALAYLIDNTLLEGKPGDAARQAIALRWRQLWHAEPFVLETKLDAASAEVFLRGRFRRFHAAMHTAQMTQPGRRFPPDVVAAWQSCREDEEAMIQRVLRAKSAALVQDAALFCLGGDPTDYWEKSFASDDEPRLQRYEALCGRQLDLCRRFAYLGEENGDSPHLPERPAGCCAQMGTVPVFFPTQWLKIFPVPPPRTAGGGQLQAYLKFLEGAQGVPNKTVQTVARVEIGRVRELLERGAPDTAVVAIRRADQPATNTPRGSQARESSTLKTAVIVRPIALAVGESGRQAVPLASPIDRWLPAGPSEDLLISQGHCFLVKQRGQAAPIAEDLAIDGPKAVFDGRFDWVFGHHGDGPLLAVIDPADGQATCFTAADGLPATGLVAALAALGQGRACVLGNSGGQRQGRQNEDRTWVALAEFDRAGGRTFRVIHVARRLPAGNDPRQSSDADVSFHCSAICVLAQPPTAAGPAEQRVLVARSFGPQQRARPLLIDPRRQHVEVLSAAINAQRACVLCETEGSFYWIDDLVPPRNTEGTLYRLGFPELRPVAVRERVPARGQVFLDAGRLVVRSQEDGKPCWYMSDRMTDPLRKLGLQGAEPPQFGPLSRSMHYGLVELTDPPLEIVLP